jgi:hypothetical protein
MTDSVAGLPGMYMSIAPLLVEPDVAFTVPGAGLNIYTHLDATSSRSILCEPMVSKVE